MSGNTGYVRTQLLKLTGIIVIILVLAAGMSALTRPRRSDGYTSCLSNLKHIGVALNMYQTDWDGTLPVLRCREQRSAVGESWWDTISPYARNKMIMNCPGTKGHTPSRDRIAYSFNSTLSGMKKNAMREPGDVAVIWDSVNDSPANNNLNGSRTWRWGDKGMPATGDLVIWPRYADFRCRRWPAWAQPRHHGINNVLFADGHASQLEPGAVPRLSPR